MYCENCGKKNDDTATKCVNCGYKLEKKDLFSFDEDEFKIDSKDFEGFNDDFFSKNKSEENEIKEKEANIIIEKEIKEETKEELKEDKINNYKENDVINNSNNKMSFPIGKNKHVVDLYMTSKNTFLGVLILLFLAAIPVVIILNADFERNGLFFSIVCLFFLGLVIFIGTTIILSIFDTKKAKKALTNGKNNTAEIINLYVSNAKKQVGNKESYINKYYMVFKYKIDNTDHQTTQCVKETTYNKFKIGDVINIKTYNNVGVLNENIRQI